MTLKQCIEAFDALLNQNLTYNGSEVIFSFENHTMALGTIIHARDALSTMKTIEGK
jgi:hypothetical protein